MSSWMVVKVFPRSVVLFRTRSPLSSASTVKKKPTRFDFRLALSSSYSDKLTPRREISISLLTVCDINGHLDSFGVSPVSTRL